MKNRVYCGVAFQGSWYISISNSYALFDIGVYQHLKGRYIDTHAVRIIGWGVDNRTGVPYWLVANSFNYDWGENGFFKVKRGSNECLIEADITAGIPRDSVLS